MNKYQEALIGLKNAIVYANEYLKLFSSSRMNPDIVKVIEEAIDKAEKYDEKETPCKPVRIYPPFGDNVPVKRYPKIFGCGICEEHVIKHYKYCSNCGQKLDWNWK